MKNLLVCGHRQLDSDAVSDAVAKSGIVGTRLKSGPHLPHRTDVLFNTGDLENSVWTTDVDEGQLSRWAEVMPDLRFLLIYVSPGDALATHIVSSPQQMNATHDILGAWEKCAAAMLHFYNRHRHRSLLVSADSVSEDSSVLLEAIPRKLGSARAIDRAITFDTKNSVSSIHRVLGNLLVDTGSAQSLFEELQSTADIPAGDETLAIELPVDAWREYLQLADKLSSLEATRDSLHQEVCELKRSNQAISSRLPRLHAVEQRLKSLVEAVESKGRGTENDLAELRHELDAALDRGDLLHEKLQLAQREIEQGKAARATLSQNLLEASGRHLDLVRMWLANHPATVRVDFLGAINGDNWYYAESDGRWAGPGRRSTVSLPVLRSTGYRAELEVVDAMTPEILSGTVMSLNGEVLELRRSGRRFPLKLVAEFDGGLFQDDPIWEFQFEFPGVVSPAASGSDDARSLAIRVRSLTISTVR